MPHLFPALIATGLSQAFPHGKLGLAPTDISVDPGTVHCVVGLSGSGKSVFAEILAGVVQPASGSIHVQGQLTSFKGVTDAAAKGVRYVGQKWDTHSKERVVDVLDLGPPPRKFGFVDSQAQHAQAKAHLKQYGLEDVDPALRVCDLPIGQQKLLIFAATLSKPMTLLILDDPTASLTDAETNILVEHLSRLKFSQTGIVYFTTNPEEALAMGDRISVLRDGHLIATHDPAGIFANQLRGEMVGRDTSQDPPRRPKTTGPEVAIRVEGLSVNPHIIGFSVKAKRGEVVGLLGLHAAGQSEILQSMVGVVPRSEGAVFVKGSATPARTSTREHALESGIGIIPEPWGRYAEEVKASIGVATRQPLRNLNSDNPQKAPIASCLEHNCSVLLFDNPTRGLNAACRLEVCRTIDDLAESGVAVIAASTDVEELMSFCDRIILITNGAATRTFERSIFNADKIRAALKNPR